MRRGSLTGIPRISALLFVGPSSGPQRRSEICQPGCIRLYSQLHGRVRHSTALRERRLHIEHTNDGRTQHRGRQGLQLSQPQNVRTRLQRGLGRPPNLVAARDERDRPPLDDLHANPIPTHDLERRIQPAFRNHVDDRPCPPSNATRADRRETQPITRKRPRSVTNTHPPNRVRRRRRGTRTPAPEQNGDPCGCPRQQSPAAQAQRRPIASNEVIGALIPETPDPVYVAPDPCAHVACRKPTNRGNRDSNAHRREFRRRGARTER